MLFSGLNSPNSESTKVALHNILYTPLAPSIRHSSSKDPADPDLSEGAHEGYMLGYVFIDATEIYLGTFCRPFPFR